MMNARVKVVVWGGCAREVPPSRKNRGFSLPEILIYMVVVALIVFSLLTLYMQQQMARDTELDYKDVTTVLDLANRAAASQNDYSMLGTASLLNFQAMNALPYWLNNQTSIFKGRSGGVLSVFTGHSVPSEPTLDVFSVQETGLSKEACLLTVSSANNLYSVTVNGGPLPYSASSGYQNPDISKFSAHGICSSASNTVVFGELKQNDSARYRVTPAAVSPYVDPITPSTTWVATDFARMQAAVAARLALQAGL